LNHCADLQAASDTTATMVLLFGAGHCGRRDSKPSPEQVAAVNALYGFDRPVIVQYVDYLGGLARGDLGTSYIRKQPVSDIIGQRLGSTLTLTITALVASWLIAAESSAKASLAVATAKIPGRQGR
jgi:ABC-type dipeptide/oligopeptide/nickel transport system permease component